MARPIARAACSAHHATSTASHRSVRPPAGPHLANATPRGMGPSATAAAPPRVAMSSHRPAMPSGDVLPDAVSHASRHRLRRRARLGERADA